MVALELPLDELTDFLAEPACPASISEEADEILAARCASL
jgi:hypothetical protein